MRRIKKSRWIIIGILLFLLGVHSLYQVRGEELIKEEVNPIREDNIIQGMEYILTIGEQVRDSSFVVSTHILDSIYHYKDMKTIDSFFIRLVVNNKSHYHYRIEKIYVIDTVTNIYKQEFSSCDTFWLEKDFFEEYQSSYQVQIEFSK